MHHRFWTLLVLLALVPLDGLGCGDTTNPDDDDDDASPSVEIPEDWDVPFAPPDGVSVEEVEGVVTLPPGFAFAPEELSVRSWFGGRRPVDANGRFTTVVNTEGTAALEVLDPSGMLLFTVAHAESEELAATEIDVSVSTALATELLMTPGWIIDDPIFSDPLMRAFQTMDGFSDLVARGEAELIADPHALQSPSEDLVLGMGEVAGEVLDRVPDLRDELLAYIESRQPVGDRARAYEVVPEACKDATSGEKLETQNLQFRDLDGCPRDEVVFENVQVTEDILSIGKVTNLSGRPVWIYVDAEDSEYGALPPDDKFEILAILAARKLQLPTVSQIVTRLVTELPLIAGRLLVGKDPAQVIARMGQRTVQYLQSFIEQAKEEDLAIDISGYGRSTVSVYGMGIGYGRNEVQNSRRVIAPWVHGLVTQFVFPLLKLVMNHAGDASVLKQVQKWEPLLDGLASFADNLTNVFQPGAVHYNHAELIWTLAGIVKDSAGKIVQALIELGAVLVAGGPNAQATAEARLTTALQNFIGLLMPKLLPWAIADTVIDVVNLLAAATVTAIAIGSLDMVDKYLADPKAPATQPPGLPDEIPEEPDPCATTPPATGSPPGGDFFVLGRAVGAGGIARLRWDASGEAVEQLDTAPEGQAPLWGPLFGVEGGGARGFDVGGEQGDSAFVSVDDGTLRIIDLFDGRVRELDADRDATTTSPDAPDGITRLEPGLEPRGVHHFHAHPFVAVATQTDVVVYDSVRFEEVGRLTGADLRLRDFGSGIIERPFDIATTPDDATMFVSMPGTFLNDGDRVVAFDMTAFLRDRTVTPTWIDPFPGDPLNDALDLGPDPNPRWLDMSPNGELLAVTLTDTHRVAVITTCHGRANCLPEIHDVHPGDISQQFLQHNPVQEGSYGTRALTWADDETLYATWDFGHGRLSGHGVVRRCHLDWGVEDCDAASEAQGAVCPAVYGQCGHEVAVEGRPRGIAVFGTGTSRRVAVADDLGFITVLRDELFEQDACFLGTTPPPNPVWDGTGGCITDAGGFEMIADSCTDTDRAPNIGPPGFVGMGGEAIVRLGAHRREQVGETPVEDDVLHTTTSVRLRAYEAEEAASQASSTPFVAPSCSGSTFTGDVEFEDVADMQSFCAQYSEIDGDLVLSETGLMTAWSGSCLCEVTGDLVIDGNQWLQGIEAWSRLRSVGGSLIVSENAALATLTGFGGLRDVGGDLVIEENPTLLSASGLRGLDTVGGSVLVQNNPLLGSAAVDEWVSEIGSIGGTTVNQGNGP